MISEATLFRNVAIQAKSLGKDQHRLSSPISSRSTSLILTRLLEILASERVSKVHGYYLGITGLVAICRAKVTPEQELGEITFSVVYKCRTFKPFKGETLNGVVYHVCNNGVFVRCGPVKSAYISSLKMPGYVLEKLQGKDRRFVSQDRATIENGIVLRFSVMAVRWSDESRNSKNGFQMLGNLDGESLGPVLFPASAELDL